MRDLHSDDERKRLHAKKDILAGRLKQLGSVLIAFSGGVDSTFLLAVAHQVLGRNAVACTATSVIYPLRELEEAVAFTKEQGIEHVLTSFDAMKLSCFSENQPDRCYHCKKHVFKKVKDLAEQKGLKHVAHAVNLDDLTDYRPGLRAAEEMGAVSPLVDAQLNKEDIRLLSKEMGLPTWNKPSMACLASRIPFGERITEKKLRMVQEGEALLASLGFKQFRVRHHGAVARIEVEPEDLPRIVEEPTRARIVSRLREVGFTHVALDLEGYISGSLNRTIKREKTEYRRQKTEDGSQESGGRE